jgi:hypothetical protein
MPSPFAAGDIVDFEGETYTVLRVVSLSDVARWLPDKERWGTHVVLLRRQRDGRQCVANWFESGRLTPPEDWLEDYL